MYSTAIAAMKKSIYQLLQDAIPQLQVQLPPSTSGDLHQLYDWINQQHTFMHYVELKEFEDNGIEYNYYFKKYQVDTDALQADIYASIEHVFAEFAAEDLEIDADANAYINARILMDEQVEEIVFDHIHRCATQHQLKLLIIVRENPYWLLIPNMKQEFIDQLVGEFNQNFKVHEDLLMLQYAR